MKTSFITVLSNMSVTGFIQHPYWTELGLLRPMNMGFFLCECLKKTDFHASDKNITNLYLLKCFIKPSAIIPRVWNFKFKGGVISGCKGGILGYTTNLLSRKWLQIVSKLHSFNMGCIDVKMEHWFSRHGDYLSLWWLTWAFLPGFLL